MSEKQFPVPDGNRGDGSPSEAEDLNAHLEGARYALIKSLTTGEGAREFVQSISLEPLLREECDWGALLSAAPRALCSMGQCFVIASTPMSSSIQLATPNTLQYNSLRANLVHCSDLGRAAFREAETKMSKVSMITQFICESNGTIDKILRALNDDALTRRELPRQLDRLKKFSEQCVQDAKAVKDQFSIWQRKAEEIRLVCVESDHESSNKATELTNKFEVVSMQKTHLEDEVKQAKIETNDARDDVDFHREQFHKTSDDLPTGWNGLAFQAVGAVADGLGMVVEKAASLFSFNFAFVEKDAKILGPGIAISAPTYDPNDCGFVIAERLFNNLKNFVKLLGDGRSDDVHCGMDWKSLSGYGNPANSVKVFQGMLHQYLADPRLQTKRTKISSDMENILQRALVVTKEMVAYMQRETTYGKARNVELDRGTVRSWQSTIKACLVETTVLVEMRASAREEYNAGIKGSRENSSVSSKSRLSMLQVARDNYNSSQSALLEAQKRLSERAERERKAKEQFNSIQRELEKLGSENITMKEVKSILSKCMNNLQKFQEHLSSLITFFTELHTFVEQTYQLRAQDFIDSATTCHQIIDDTPELERGAQRQRSMENLLVDALKLRGYYSVLREIAGTYVEVSRKHIMPGVDQVDRLSLTDEEGAAVSKTRIQAKMKQIATFAEEAQKTINELADKRKKGLLDQLMARRGDAEEIGYMINAAEGPTPSGLGDSTNLGKPVRSITSVEDTWAL